MKCCLLRIYLRLSARVSHKAKRGAVAIYYGVPRKSAAIAWQKDLFRFLPVGQGDSKYQHIYSSKKRECILVNTPSFSRKSIIIS